MNDRWSLWSHLQVFRLVRNKWQNKKTILNPMCLDPIVPYKVKFSGINILKKSVANHSYFKKLKPEHIQLKKFKQVYIIHTYYSAHISF